MFSEPQESSQVQTNVDSERVTEQPTVDYFEQPHISRRDLSHQSPSGFDKIDGTPRQALSPRNIARLLPQAPYPTISVRDEGPQAMHLAGTHCDPRIRPGYFYKTYYGASPEYNGALRPVYPSVDGKSECLMTSLRSSSVPGAYVFKVQGRDHLYSDQDLQPHGYVFFAHALSQDERFIGIVDDEPIISITVRETSFEQIELEHCARQPGLALPHAHILFEKQTDYRTSPIPSDVQGCYDIKMFVVQSKIEIENLYDSPYSNSKGDSSLSVTFKVYVSNREGKALALIPTAWDQEHSSEINLILSNVTLISRDNSLMQTGFSEVPVYTFQGSPTKKS